MCANKISQLPGFSDRPLTISSINEQPPKIILIERNVAGDIQNIKSTTIRLEISILGSLTSEEVSKSKLYISEKTIFKDFPKTSCESYLVEVKSPSNGSITFTYEFKTLE